MGRFIGIIVALLIIASVSGIGIPGFSTSTGQNGEELGFLDNGEVLGRWETLPDKKGDVATITVYYDRVEYEKDTEEESPFFPSSGSIMFSDIKKLNSWGTNFLIRSHSGTSIEFQILNGRSAGKLKRRIKELMEEEGASPIA